MEKLYQFECRICNAKYIEHSNSALEEFLIEHLHNKTEQIIQKNKDSERSIFIGNIHIRCLHCQLSVESNRLSSEFINEIESHLCEKMKNIQFEKEEKEEEKEFRDQVMSDYKFGN